MLERFWRQLRINRIAEISHGVLLAGLFFLGLELISAFHRFIVIFSGLLLALLAWGIALVRYEEEHYWHPIQVILPTMAAAGLVGFSLFLPRTPLLHVYFLLSAALIYWLLRHGVKWAYPTWNWVLATVIVFINVAVAEGLAWNLNFAVVPLLAWLATIIGAISLQAYWRIAPNPPRAALVSVALTVALTELAWTLRFLPVHWLVQAGVITVFYYLAFHVVSISFERPLRQRDVIEYAVLGIGTVAVLLATARWH